MYINIEQARGKQANYVHENRKEAKQANDVQYMSVAETGWTGLLCKRIPERHAKRVNYVGEHRKDRLNGLNM